jgi:hypothetical protein
MRRFCNLLLCHCIARSKYKFMETQMLQQKKNLMTKVPDIKNALDAIDFLVAKQV